MRAPKDENGNPVPYNEALCRATRQLRTRLSEALDRIDALELELAAERAEIADERAALVAQMESPEAARDVMMLAQDLLQSEVITALAGPDKRATCRSCGGLGKGFTKGLLVERIKAHCRDHDLPETVEPMEESRWPNFPALNYGWGRDWSWHKPEEPKRPAW